MKSIKKFSGDRASLVDMFARSITYLRVSVTDHCNLGCVYCTPKRGEEKLASSELLTYEELLRVVKLAVNLGVKKVRLTGGEPLVRRGIISFIERLTAVPGLDDIRLTTNGVLLPQYGEALHRAGIRKINISLDTLRRQRFAEITGVDALEQVLAGIELAERLGFAPIKLNMVVMQGVNDDELLDFAGLALRHPYQVRFIEFMPVGGDSIWEQGKYMDMNRIMERLAPMGKLLSVERNAKEGPAKIYRVEGGAGTIGFISPISSHFCDQCNRLRLTSEGRLRSCLLLDREVDLKTILRGGGSDDDIRNALVQAVLNKPKGHQLAGEREGASCHGRMSRIGG